jgi:tetratricopeptide (TPR) repeat protein
MNRPQYIAIAGAIALFFTLYFGCDVKSKEQEKADIARSMTTDILSPESLIAEATKALNGSQRAEIQSLTSKAEAEKTPSVLEALSKAWHDAGHDEVAAVYAERIATTDKTDERWSIAGANYYLALQKAEDPTMREFCSRKAVECFQNAASLNPSKIEHRLNIALCFAENPPQDNPMKGILQLRELDAQNPDNVPVNFHLARLAIKTGQFDRAIGRLEKVLTKEPNNAKLLCLLADAYAGANSPKAAEAAKKCSENQ